MDFPRRRMFLPDAHSFVDAGKKSSQFPVRLTERKKSKWFRAKFDTFDWRSGKADWIHASKCPCGDFLRLETGTERLRVSIVSSDPFWLENRCGGK